MTQITGHAEFCELFLDDVVVPKENLLGERGDGWKIAMHTLGHERGTAALPRQVKLRTWLDRAVRVAAERTLDGEALIDDPEVAGRARARADRRSRSCATTPIGRSGSSSTAARSAPTARA